jgi:hypothetical protein
MVSAPGLGIFARTGSSNEDMLSKPARLFRSKPTFYLQFPC